MRGWFQVLIFVAFIILPVVSRVLQSIAEKQAANREKKRREVRPTENATAMLKGHQEGGTAAGSTKARQSPQASAEATQREELARRRRAELEAWRAKRGRATQTGGGVPPASARGGQIAPVPAPNAGDLMNPATGEQLVRDFLQQAERHAQRSPQRAPSSSARGGARGARSGSRGRTKTTLEEPLQAKHEAGSASESEIHRLVRDTPNKRSWAVDPAGSQPAWARGAGPMSGVGGVSDLRRVLRSRAALRSAFMMKEILERPIALRESPEY